MAVGDITLKYAAAAEVVWTTEGDGPRNLADNALSLYSDEQTPAAPVVDVMIGMKFKTITGSLQTNPAIFIYAATPGDGTNYPPLNRDGLMLVGRPIRVNASLTSEFSNQFSLAAAFGGILPAKYKIAVFNDAGLALTNVADDNEVTQQAVFAFQTV